MVKGLLAGREQEIVRLYEQGESSSTLAKMLGVRRQVVCRFLSKAGKLRTLSESARIAHQRGRFADGYLHRRKLDYDRVVQLYQRGMSCQEVADETGYTRGAVARVIKKVGVVRSQADALKLAQDKGRWASTYWKGRRYKTEKGYIMVRLKPDDFFYSMANKNGYVPEHRLVMAQHLGRCLHSWEIVHHKDGNKQNNALDNLQIVSDGGHKQVTQMETRIADLEVQIRQLKAQLGASQ